MKLEIPSWFKKPYVIVGIIIVLGLLYYFFIHRKKTTRAPPIQPQYPMMVPPNMVRYSGQEPDFDVPSSGGADQSEQTDQLGGAEESEEDETSVAENALPLEEEE